MYITTPESHVVALNAATGEKLWEFIPRLAENLTVCCGPINRGVAAWGDKVYVGTPDARLIALNNRNGQVAWQTVVPDSGRTGYSITMAPDYKSVSRAKRSEPITIYAEVPPQNLRKLGRVSSYS